MPPCRHTSVAPRSRRLHGALGDVVEGEQVRRPPQVERQRPLAEAAERAPERAHVGVVDVAVDDVGDRVADGLAAQVVGHLGHRGDLGTARPEQGDDLRLADLLAGAGRPRAPRATAPPPIRQRSRLVAHRRRRRIEERRGGWVSAPEYQAVERRPICTTSAPVPTLAAAWCRSGQVAPGSSRPRPSASERSCTGKRRAGSSQRSGSTAYDGWTRQPRREREAALLGGGAQGAQRRPGTFGVDVVDGDRRDPAPVVEAGVEQVAEPVGFGEVRRGLDVDVGREHQPGQGDRPDVVLGRARRGGAHRGAGLGQEVLDDDLLHVPVPGVARRDRLERLDPVDLVLADADQDAGGEGDRELARRLEGGQPTLGRLVRRAAVGGQVGAQRLDHHPLGRRDRAQAGQLLAGDRAGVHVGEQAGLRQHQGPHRDEVVDRRGVAVVVEPAARLGVPLLRGLAQREQRLVAAGLRALGRDGEDLVRGQVRRRDVARGGRERAVAAPVAAQPGERDEDLGGVRDAGARRGGADLAGAGRELSGREPVPGDGQGHGHCPDTVTVPHRTGAPNRSCRHSTGPTAHRVGEIRGSGTRRRPGPG